MSNAFCERCEPAGDAALLFAGIYAAIILLAYVARLTAVRLDGLYGPALRIFDYGCLGLFFSCDLLGCGLMALSAFCRD